MENRTIDRFTRVVGAASLLLFPSLLILVFALHFQSVADFFTFRWKYEPVPARQTVTRLIAEAGGEPILHDPHVLAYLSVPWLLAMALTMARLLWRRKPWLALVGATLSCTGAVFLGGLFATWSAFPALGRMPAEQIESAIVAWEVLTAPQGVLLLTTYLSYLSLLGLIVLAVGLAAALIWLYPQGRFLFILLTVLVGCQRIVSGAHYPSDVLVGAAVGCLISTLFLHVGLLPKWFDRWEQRWRST